MPWHTMPFITWSCHVMPKRCCCRSDYQHHFVDYCHYCYCGCCCCCYRCHTAAAPPAVRGGGSADIVQLGQPLHACWGSIVGHSLEGLLQSGTSAEMTETLRRHVTTRHDTARHHVARHGMGGQGMAWHIVVRFAASWTTMACCRLTWHSTPSDCSA